MPYVFRRPFNYAVLARRPFLPSAGGGTPPVTRASRLALMGVG